MAKLGFVNLPPKRPSGGFKIIKPLTAKEVGFQKPKTLIIGKLDLTEPPGFGLVNKLKEAQLWRYLIQRYHYLGYKIIVGRYLKYLIYLKGTWYKAANWIYLGRTCGKGRQGAKYFYHGKIRDYYVYPLARDALAKLKTDD